MLLRKKEEIEAWLNQYNVKNYELIEDDTYGYVVNVNDNVNLSSKKLKNIEVKFNKVKNFFCDDNELESLQGCPEIVEKNFTCSNNKLITLEDCPKTIERDFYCDRNKITSLKGCPKIVKGYFNCEKNYLKSLKDGPEIVGKYNFTEKYIDSLDGLFDIKNGKMVSRYPEIETEKDRIDRITNINLSCTNDFDIFKNKVLGKANDLKIFIDLQRNKLLSEKNTNKPKF